MDRFSIVIERQKQLEALIKEWGFLPFFKNGIAGFSIEEMTPPELLFGDEMENGPWQWKGPIIANRESAYGKFFQKKAGYVSLEWLPDFMNWRRSLYPLKKESADARHIHEVLVENEPTNEARAEDNSLFYALQGGGRPLGQSMLSKQLKVASGFTLSRKKSKFNPENPSEPIVNKRNGMAFDALIAQLQMGTHVCIADFEYLVSKKGETYGWGVARYCTPEAMYPDLFPLKDRVEPFDELRIKSRTPKQSRKRIIDHLQVLFPDVDRAKIEKLI